MTSSQETRNILVGATHTNLVIGDTLGKISSQDTPDTLSTTARVPLFDFHRPEDAGVSEERR